MMRARQHDLTVPAASIALALALAVGCGARTRLNAPPARRDAGADATADARPDGPPDARPDVRPDARACPGPCDDGIFCNGREVCDPMTGRCRPGMRPTCDDGVECTVDTCDPDTDSCRHTRLDRDEDGDGYSACGADCDDTRADVHPGAPEVCDGIDNDCDGTIADEDASCPSLECPSEVSATVLETVTLRARGEDPDGGPVHFDWRVLERPEGSVSEPEPRDRPVTSLYLDASGTFVLELCIEDDEGDRACCRVEVTSVAPGALHWELSWGTPYGDVDLHVLDQSRTPPAGWWTRDDCHYENTSPDWGPAGDAGDPNLDIDDTDGFGPENVTIDVEPQPGTYHAAVHYYCQSSIGSGDEDEGPTTATLRVFCAGRLVATYDDLPLPSTDRWITVAALDYPSCAGRSVDDRTWGHLVGDRSGAHCTIECRTTADCPGEEHCGRGLCR